MDKLSVIKSQLACEITQKDELQKNLILQILCSRRLLSEHLESLEEIANTILVEEAPKSNYLSFLSTSTTLLSSYAIFHFCDSNIRYLIPCLTGAIPIVYMQKKINTKQRMFFETQLKDFIKSLDDFEFSVKKATNFINDAQHINKIADNLKRCSKSSRNISRDLLNLTKRVIRALYCFVKYLEYCYKIDDKYQYVYQDIEDVDNCKLLTTDIEDENNSPNTFKEMFALFAYVQSYLLLRIGFICATNLEEGKFIIKKKLCDITNKIKHQTSLLPNFLLLQKEESDLQNNVQKLIDTEMNKTISKELVHIRSSTVDFTLKVLSLVLNLKDYQEMLIQLTNNYQSSNKTEMNDVINYLEMLGSQISDCSDEQNRLLILMKRYLNKDTEELKIIERAVGVDNEEKPLKIAEENAQVQSDDFFYVDPDQENFGEGMEEEKKESDKADDLDEEDLEIKLTKKCFKPVLAQLKERIVPIEADMKAREKKVLKEKGIEITEEPEKTDVKLQSLSDDDHDSDVELDWKRQQKYDRNRQKYDENREFLQTKSQVNLFGQGNLFPIKNSFIGLHEEVLE